MGTTNPFKDQPYSSLKKLLPWTLYALLPIALLRIYFYPISFSSVSPDDDQFSANNRIVITSPPPPSPPPASRGEEQESTNVQVEEACDYTNGKWVRDKSGPLYNGTTCGTIKEGQNCMSHGRPDNGYLYWRWKPNRCRLPRFEPQTFLRLISNKHIAFVGDSMARNQLESLLCMLATASLPDLVYRDGEDNKFRRWHFPSHNANVSIYWSPFLVKGVEKSNNGTNYNRLFLDSVDERWAGDMGQIDMIVLSVGHWFLHPAVFFYGDSVLGCHYCPGQNYTEIGFYDVFGKAFKTTLETIISRRGRPSPTTADKELRVVVTTFSPAHFEGEWDKLGACPKTEPYKTGEKELEGMDADMRRVELEEVKSAKSKAEKSYQNLKVEALDVSKLSFLRPDGHPGPYMHPFPFADGVAERVQNDCVHWCLPGPIDTWNEILLDLMKRWEKQSKIAKR